MPLTFLQKRQNIKNAEVYDVFVLNTHDLVHKKVKYA